MARTNCPGCLTRPCRCGKPPSIPRGPSNVESLRSIGGGMVSIFAIISWVYLLLQGTVEGATWLVSPVGREIANSFLISQLYLAGQLLALAGLAILGAMIGETMLGRRGAQAGIFAGVVSPQVAVLAFVIATNRHVPAVASAGAVLFGGAALLARSAFEKSKPSLSSRFRAGRLIYGGLFLAVLGRVDIPI